MYSLGCVIYELFNLSIYYNDREYEKIKKTDINKYNNKQQEIINSLLQIDYNKRMDRNQIYDIILGINWIIGEIYIDKDNINKDVRIINSYENFKSENDYEDGKEDYKYNNEKEIKENIEIKIN